MNCTKLLQLTGNIAEDSIRLICLCSNAYGEQTQRGEATLVGEEQNYIIDHIVYEQKKSREKSILKRSQKRQDGAP